MMTLAQIWQFVWEKAPPYLLAAGLGIGVFVAFWIAAALASRVILRVGGSRSVDPDVTQLLAFAAKLSLLIFGAITAMGTLGIDVTAMVAGLGLTGLALGLAMKEVVSNAISGVLILIYKPFKRKDSITVLTHQGVVLETNLRYTVLDSGGSKIYIPNTILLTNSVIVGPIAAPTQAASPKSQD
jgi:small-conductance mechanosensitive channel